MSQIDKTEISEQIAASIRKFSEKAKGGQDTASSFIEMPEFIQQKAELISAHFLLPSGSRLVNIACESGEITYMLAQLNPHIDVIGIDSDEKVVEFACKTYKLPNLSYMQSDISIPDFEDESLDAIIDSNILHGVYSEGGYDREDVSQLLAEQIKKLKPGGTILIRDYMKPSEDDLALIEFPDVKSKGKSVLQMSDVDLLILFSQSARPLPTGGCEGFFIEELPPKRKGTRLFRLPHKWAVEFVHRKNHRAHWDEEIKQEYTFFTWQDYRREFARMGMRMVFSAPYWNAWVIDHCFKGCFQMYSEDGSPMRYPATNYFIVAQKVSDKQSMLLEERRPSQKPVGDLKIITVRDQKTGIVHELVKRPKEYCDIVPYRITPDNRLLIFVRSGYPRPIINAVLRGHHNLDGKKWSGHLIEPIVMETAGMTGNAEKNRQMIFGHLKDYLKLRPKSDKSWYLGETYFPDPDRIDEGVEPVFIEVENPQRTKWSLAAEKDVTFVEQGVITELNATDIISASQVGLLPEPRLEMYVMDLMERYNIPFPNWIGSAMPKIPRKNVKIQDPETALKNLDTCRFEKEKLPPKLLKPVKAVFVEEGKVGRATRGLSAQDIEFIVSEDGVENIAVVLPLSRDWDNNLLVALEPKILPVPNRMGGDGALLTAPSFLLPKDVKNVDDAKQFVADKFKVPLDNVRTLGESYFTHVGITPSRVFPFTVTSAASVKHIRNCDYMMAKNLKKLSKFGRFGGDAIKLLARVNMQLGAEHAMSLRGDMDLKKNKGYQLSQEKIVVKGDGIGHASAPSRILGERAAATTGGRLSQSYAQAKMSLRETMEMKEKAKGIKSLAQSLKKHLSNPVK